MNWKTFLTKENFYPLVIVRDRYSGSYSGGTFTAWNREIFDIPKEIWADDVECQAFWLDYDKNNRFVGIGNTAELAIEDLIRRMVLYLENRGGK